jgi:hypothetical protein
MIFSNTLAQVLRSTSKLFAVVEGVADTALNITQWSEESTRAFRDEARIKRLRDNKALMLEAGITAEELKAIE